jgi:hypothetical protein
MAFKIKLAPDFDEKRMKSFSAVCTDVHMEEMKNGDNTMIVYEFGEDLPLKIKLDYNKWVDDERLGAKTPSTKSSIYKHFASLGALDIDVEISDELDQITMTPSLMGKECYFDCESKTFTEKIDGVEQVDEDGNPKLITFYVWRLKKISEQTTLAAVTSQVKASVPTVSAAPVEEMAVDMRIVKKNWFTIVSDLPEPFTFPQMIASKGKFMMSAEGKKLTDAEKAYYNVAATVKAQIESMVTDGFLIRNSSVYTRAQDKIDAEMQRIEDEILSEMV